MKVRSLRQVLHWLFLVIGIFSVFMLAFSVSTYLDYARDGYGLRISVDEAWLDGNSLALRLDIENPGGMDLLLGTAGNLTITETSEITFSEVSLEAGTTTPVLLFFELSQDEIDNIKNTGLVDFSLNLEVTVIERQTITNIRFDTADQEVDL